uniref:Helitron helicase-like domain-containing protein n=1 Tax=Amphimedon queenslandica TaxID=400682 RepID=A0A1X7TYX2_AMPQE
MVTKEDDPFRIPNSDTVLYFQYSDAIDEFKKALSDQAVNACCSFILQRGVLGKLEQYYDKKEYQMRGAPHYHILLWIQNAPVVDIDHPEEVCSFIQDRITCHIPDMRDSICINDFENSLKSCNKIYYLKQKEKEV